MRIPIVRRRWTKKAGGFVYWFVRHGKSSGTFPTQKDAEAGVRATLRLEKENPATAKAEKTQPEEKLMSKHGEIPTDRKTVLEHIDIYLSSDTFDQAVNLSPYSRQAFTILLEKTGLWKIDCPESRKKRPLTRDFGYLYSLQNQVDIYNRV